MNRTIRSIDPGRYPSFRNSYNTLSDDIKASVGIALKDLLLEPQPKRLRLEELQGNI